LYYKSFYEVVSFHASFLFLLLLVREIVKDLENIPGDLANDYRTIPIVYGEAAAKKAITVLLVLTVIPVYYLVNVYDVGYMDIYFYVGFIIMIFFGIKLWKSDTKAQFLLLHNTLKLLIVAGVFSIALINPEVLWHGKKLLTTI